MTAMTETRVTTQVYRVYIKATPQAIWDAITRPEWTARYGYGGRAEFDLRPTGSTVTSPVPRCAQGAHPRSQWMAKSSRPIRHANWC